MSGRDLHKLLINNREARSEAEKAARREARKRRKRGKERCKERASTLGPIGHMTRTTGPIRAQAMQHGPHQLAPRTTVEHCHDAKVESGFWGADTVRFFTFAVDIGRHSRAVLRRAFRLLVRSLDRHLTSYQLVCFSNFMDVDKRRKKSIECRKYVPQRTVGAGGHERWITLSFDKIRKFKDLHDEFGVSFTWIDLDTQIAADVSYFNRMPSIFIEHGGLCTAPNPLFIDNTTINVPRHRYIQGDLWKLDIELYGRLMKTLERLSERGLKFRYDLQDLFSYYLYIENKAIPKDIHILGHNSKIDTLNGLGVWSRSNHHPNVNGLRALYRDSHCLRSRLYGEKEIHVLSFTFHSLKKIWDCPEFADLFD